MSRRLTLIVLLSCLGYAQSVDAQCYGYAVALTTESSRLCASYLEESTLSWTFRLDCFDDCGSLWTSTPQESATATGECVEVGWPGEESKCMPDFEQYNYTSGMYGTTNSFDEEMFGGCHDDVPVVTQSNCPCAPDCTNDSDETPTTNDQDSTPDHLATEPLILSLEDAEYELSSADDPVAFDLDADGTKELISWTAAGSDEAFLVLDRDQDGVVDDGMELFGDVSPQLPSAEPNGFRALAVFDDPLNGGNGDGWIDRRDPIFEHLQLWVDADHDGETDDGELLSLADAGVEAFHLDYRTTMRQDPHGNLYRYQAEVIRSVGPGARVAWDVFFVQAD